MARHLQVKVCVGIEIQQNRHVNEEEKSEGSVQSLPVLLQMVAVARRQRAGLELSIIQATF
jgi:hypothetical protein